MGRIITDHITCPLCLKPMRIVYTRKGKFYVCVGLRCMISIHASDPCLGRWNEKPENAPKCPIDQTSMRMFFRDGGATLVCQCPKCFATIRRGKVEEMPK